MTSVDIIKAIASSQFTADELRNINIAIRNQLNKSSYTNARSIHVGQYVKFFSPRYQVHVDGVVKKVKLKNVDVQITNPAGNIEMWVVPASVLTAA